MPQPNRTFFASIPGQRVAARITLIHDEASGALSGAISHPDFKGDAMLRGMRPPQIMAAAYERLATAFNAEALSITPEGTETFIELERRAAESLDTRVLVEAQALAGKAYQLARGSRGIWDKAVAFCKAMQSFNHETATRALTAKSELDKAADDVMAASLTVDPSIAAGKRKAA